MQILVFLLLLLVFIVVRARLSVEKPGALQHLMEGIVGFVEDSCHEIIGHDYQRYVPYICALGMFILCCNLLGWCRSSNSDRESPGAAGLRGGDLDSTTMWPASAPTALPTSSTSWDRCGGWRR